MVFVVVLFHLKVAGGGGGGGGGRNRIFFYRGSGRIQNYFISGKSLSKLILVIYFVSESKAMLGH